MIALYNKKNKEQLMDDVSKESFERIPLSFYKYVKLKNLIELRDQLYQDRKKLEILGRIYIAEEGINAQISIPKHSLNLFKKNLNENPSFIDMSFKIAVEENVSFYKLIIKVKKEIVAYGITANEYNINQTGKHLNAKEFNAMMKQKKSVIVDMRNHYESEVGRFENAICPDVDTSKELLSETKKLLEEKHSFMMMNQTQNNKKVAYVNSFY